MKPQIRSGATEPEKTSYSARHSYGDYQIGVEYERRRFSGPLGRYRWRREQAAVRKLVTALPSGISILDCPCGTGRWWPALSKRASEIYAVDLSPGMLEHAAARASDWQVPVHLLAGDAESLPLADNSVDYTFSFALMKHLPRPVQYRVLREFARVSRFGVVCTFGVFGHVSYELWRRRSVAESYPMVIEELRWMAAAAGLQVIRSVSCTTPVGVERLVHLAPLSSD